MWQTLLSKATYNWGVHKAIHLGEAIRQRSARNAKSQSCSNKYKLAREGEKDKGKGFFFFFFFFLRTSLGRSQVVPKEMSFQCCLKIDRDPAFRIGVGRLFHHPGMVNRMFWRVI